MSVIIELSIFPTDKGESVSEHVARAVNIIEDSGLSYQVNPMGTCIEGAWPEVLKVVDKCFTTLQQDCHRIYATIKVDYRKSRSDGLKGKVESVLSKT